MRSVTKRKGKAPIYEVIDATGSEPPRKETRKSRASPTSRFQNKRLRLNGIVGEAKPSVSEKSRGTPREKFLRSDPDADFQGPALVVCRLCGTKISLSTRETYGTGRWDRHIKRCRIEKADVSNLDPDAPSMNASQNPDEDLPPSFRITPGSTPLKLKISMKGLRVADDPAISEQDIPQPEYGVPAFEAIELRTGSPDQRSRYRETPSRTQEEPTKVSIASPSDAILDEVQGGLSSHDSGVTKPDKRWADGALTTSPQDIIFRDKHGPCDVAVQSVVDDTSEDQGEAVVDATQLNNVASSQKRREEGTPECPSLQKKSPVEPKGELPLLGLSQIGDSNERSSCTETHAAGFLPSPSLESELDFEYPDWEPSSASGTFEHELLTAGISLESLIHHYGAVDIKFKAYKELRVLQHA